jgi:hypothetical protein
VVDGDTVGDVAGVDDAAGGGVHVGVGFGVAVGVGTGMEASKA